MKNIFEFYMSDALLDDVGEFRRIIESACLKLAIKRSSKSELKEMHDLCEEFEHTASGFLKAPLESDTRKDLFRKLNDTDINLHSLICRMSHNDLLYYSFTTARDVIREHMSTIGYRRLMPLTRAEDLQSLQEHWRMYHIILDKPSNAETEIDRLVSNHVSR